jgi:hypothetical protein
MSDLEERDLLNQLMPLSTLVPDVRDTQRVLRSARKTVIRRTILRWTLASAAAASIAIASMLGTIYPRSTSAAELLTQSARTSSQFKGWVHIRESVQGEKDFSVQHVNNETGAWASESHTNAGLFVQMYVPAEKEEIKYSSSDGQVKIGEISQEFASGWKADIQKYALTEDALLATVPGATVRQSDDDGLIRFDVTFPADDPEKAREQHRTVYPTSPVALWVDPRSKLIVKGSATVEGKSITTERNYGDPVIHDVFDLGVPKNAKVVDARPPRDLNVLMQRLQNRFDAGFGDFIALRDLIQVASRNGKESPSEQEVEVYGASGAAYTAESFEVGTDFDRDALPSAATSVHHPTPTTWPAARLDAVLEMLKHRRPNSFFVGDGKDVWQGYASARIGMHSTKIQGQAVQTLPQLKEMFTLAGQLWPVGNLCVFGADTKAQIVMDPARPDQTGLKINRLYFMHAPDDTKLTQMYWFDPAKDDLPVDGTEVFTSTITGKVVQEEHLATLAFAQTPDGKWYPSQWTWKLTMYSPQRTSETSTEYHLQVWTHQTLGPEWFVDPATKATPLVDIPNDK